MYEKRVEGINRIIIVRFDEDDDAGTDTQQNHQYKKVVDLASIKGKVA
jgi:hypothetical protein